MPISGNTLAKYLVMVSQVIAWCTVSAMLLRRGLNQVNAVGNTETTTQRPAAPLYVNETHNDDDPVAVMAATAETVLRNGLDNETAGVHRAAGPTARTLENSGTPAVVAGIIMITIAVIMLIISPTIMLMKMIEKRNKRILDAELESPPKYEDVVESAPRYSSLFVFNNDGEMALLSEIVHTEKDDVQKQLV
ncbi:Hypothetical protein CINCED_3A007258 [Cinara cedri]|uniref:Uncharacterized protein n=1 Tax=Cinara cedri TaxID=506608 RepID=A0A5E4MXP4_9HEMI|nr:Hypothetical protein CINCED_3A007258 [Cinara cedri]